MVGNMSTIQAFFNGAQDTRRIHATSINNSNNRIQLPASNGDSFTIRFGNAKKASDIPGPINPKLTEGSKKVLKEMRLFPHPYPSEQNWPLRLMLELIKKPEVMDYIRDQGLNPDSLETNLLDYSEILSGDADIYEENPSLAPKSLDINYSSGLRHNIDKFAITENVADIDEITLWRWVMKSDPTNGINELLTKAGFDEVMIDRFRDVPAPAFDNDFSYEVPTPEQINALDEQLVNLPNRVIGQGHAVTMLVDAMQQALLNTPDEEQDPNQPNNYLLMGPSGVGKTYTVEEIASILDRELIYINLNQYGSDMDAKKLTGAAPGHVGYGDGGSFAERVDTAIERSKKQGKQPPIILFDEVEKAANSIFDTIMQVLDKGHIETPTGKVVKLKGCDVFMTSNKAQREIAKAQAEKKTDDEIKEIVKDILQSELRPEFVGRIHEEIFYKNLSHDDLLIILGNLFESIATGIKRVDNIDYVMDTSLAEHIISEGNSSLYGAREIKNLRKPFLKRPYNKFRKWLILNEKIKDGGTVYATWNEAENRVQLDYYPKKSERQVQKSRESDPAKGLVNWEATL